LIECGIEGFELFDFRSTGLMGNWVF
jgi:hypothetical protein